MSKPRSLANRILIGMSLGVVAAIATLGVGHFHPPTLQFMRQVSTAVFDPVGQVFLRMLFFVVMPLVFASLTAGVVQLGRPGRIGPLALRTLTVPGTDTCSVSILYCPSIAAIVAGPSFSLIAPESWLIRTIGSAELFWTALPASSANGWPFES